MQITNIAIDRNRKETTKHGSFAFPLAVYCSVLSRNVLGFINWHWHEELQFCRVTTGSVRFFVNEQQYLLNVGDGIFVNSGCLHMAKPAGGPDSTYVCLDASPRLLAGFPGSVFEDRYVAPYLRDQSMMHIPLSAAVPWQKQALDGVMDIYSLCEEKKFGYEFAACAALGRVWLQLLENRPATAERARQNRRQHGETVQAILAYVGAHYAERVTVEAVAREVAFNPSECCRLFKKVTGETIFSYLRSYRLAKATELLKDADMSVSRIAYETGFCGASYFIEAFRERFGVTPLQYRRNL
jgi:AraC-like DNA-binding protein